MKLAVFTACLPGLDLEEQCKLLNKNGYEGIELRVKDLTDEQRTKPFSFWGNHKSDVGVKNLSAKAKEIRKTCDKYKLEICSLGTYLNADDFEGIEEVGKNLKTLNTSQFRVGGSSIWFSPEKENYTAKYELLLKNMAKVEKLAKKYKAKALLETHMDTIVPSSGLMHRVVSRFDPKNVGVILDPGNMVYEGFENIEIQLDLLKDYISHVHLKNGRWIVKEVKLDGSVIWEPQGCSVWEGCININKTITALKKFGYNKSLSMEDFTGMEASKKVELFAKYIRNQL
ncbi:MAG: hypothetical protein A2231_05495 [Candidatus Firestonebacteria bacterium RIFOXYA2_FULL_40_8]|nr:MAG: hypothetical protein A2231_05495 [Candidatus Firestonebacteria bacterium RIFOXYA2_FULL_40_8]